MLRKSIINERIIQSPFEKAATKLAVLAFVNDESSIGGFARGVCVDEDAVGTVVFTLRSS